MALGGGIRRLFRLDRVQPTLADDLDAEIDAHLAMRVAELVAQGMTPDAARDAARRQFGDIAATRGAILAIDQVHVSHARRREWWDGLQQDVRHGVRLLRGNPTFTIVAVLTLALGIGASAAIFSIVHQVLLRPLPFRDPQQLVTAWPVRADHVSTADHSMSVPDLEDWRATQHEFVRVGAYWYAAEQSGVDLTDLGQPIRLRAAHVTPGFFETLGVQPELGRLPTVDELAEGGPRVVVISDGLWRRQFGSDPAIVGRTLRLDQIPHVVVGVMPPSMRFPGDGPDIWQSALYMSQDATPWKMRNVRWLSVIGRLAPDETVARARLDLATLQQHLAQTYPDADAGWTDAHVEPLLESIVGNVRPALLVLFVAAACVLLVASVNIAALLLARASVREREFAVRAALGAGRGRILQQVLTESLLLALLGAGLGIVVAAVVLPVLLRLGAGEVPRAPTTTIDWTVAVFTLTIGVLSGLVLGGPPALQLLAGTARPALSDTGSGARGATAGVHRVRGRQMLVAVEVAIAVVLVCGASLMAKSFRRLLAADTGFRPDSALVVGFEIPYVSDAQFDRYYETVLDRVREVPGVVSVGAAKMLPLQGLDDTYPFAIAGDASVPIGERPTVTVNHVSPQYFRSVGTQVLAGREFTPGDTMGAPEVVIVNGVFARQHLPGPVSNVPGRTIVAGESDTLRVVGVVGSVHERTLEAAPRAAVYVPTMQSPRGSVRLVARVHGDPAGYTHAVEQAIWSVNKDQTITSVTTLNDIVRHAAARPRLVSVLLVAFGVLALFLGALGIYGVVAYSVDARRQEIGVRVALGANQRDVVGMVVGRGLALALGGVAIGLLVSLVATRLMRAVLYDIAPTDPLTYAEVIVGLIGVALLAAYLPARRATRVDATEALRAM